MGTILGLGMPVFVVLTVGVILVMCVSCVGCLFCVCRRIKSNGRRLPQQQPNSDYPSENSFCSLSALFLSLFGLVGAVF